MPRPASCAGAAPRPWSVSVSACWLVHTPTSMSYSMATISGCRAGCVSWDILRGFRDRRCCSSASSVLARLRIGSRVDQPVESRCALIRVWGYCGIHAAARAPRPCIAGEPFYIQKCTDFVYLIPVRSWDPYHCKMQSSSEKIKMNPPARRPQRAESVVRSRGAPKGRDGHARCSSLQQTFRP
jgi:hypothetical protein